MNATKFLNSSFVRNGTRKGEDIKAFQYSAIRMFGVMETVLTPLIIVANICIIVTLIGSKTLRKNFRYQAIVSIATADLLIGIFICPYRAYSIFTKTTTPHSCEIRVFIQVTEEFVQMFVGTWGIVSINTYYVLTLLGIRVPRSSLIKTRIIYGISLALPWLAMLLVVLPIAYHYSGLILTKQFFCRIYLKAAARKAVISCTYVVPAIITVIQVLVMTVIYKYKQRQSQRQLTTGKVDPPWTLITASAVTTMMLFTDQVGFMHNTELQKLMPYKNYLTLALTAVIVSDAKSCGVPLVWFLIPEIRQSFRDLFDRLPCRKKFSLFRRDSSFNISYKDLCEEGRSV